MRIVRVCSFFLIYSCACFGLSAREIAQTAFKSVVLLEMDDSNGQPLSLGSGFFISNGIIATNAHVIEGASSGTAKLVGETQSLQISGIIAIDRHADLALLKVSSSAPSLVLGPSVSPIVGDDVYVVGNPLGLEGTFSTGIISGVRHLDADTILQMTAPISPGSSGGPVMDGSGAVIGISVATFSGGQNLNLAVPVSYLSKLLTARSKDLLPFGSKALTDRSEKSIVEGVGTETEKGLVVSDYQLFMNESDSWEYQNMVGKFEFRLTNKLSVGISNIRLLILYYDASDALMDFESLDYGRFPYIGLSPLPAGLAKTIEESSSATSKHAAQYYKIKGTAPKVEIRVLGFQMEQPG